MPAPFGFDRTWRFAVSVDELWRAVSDTSAFSSWWPWLDHFDGAPLEPGTVVHFRVRPPLPYSLGFAVSVDDVVEKERVDATVAGDLAGPARLELAATVDGGSTARLVWILELRAPRLATFERFARPLMTLGHDAVVAMGVRQFRRKALG